MVDGNNFDCGNISAFEVVRHSRFPALEIMTKLGVVMHKLPVDINGKAPHVILHASEM